MGAASDTARPDHPVGARARTAIGWAAGGGGTPPPATEPEAAREGYETGARLGGSGEVYEATHARLPGRFAIKFLTRARGVSGGAIESFQDEAERISVLRHPNIVEVLELGVMPDGTPIIVMEHLEGRSLDQILATRGPMPAAEVLSIVRGIGTALHAAHEVKVVHREVRPDNVFIAKVAGYEQGFVKMLDFGVSRLALPGPAQGLSAAAARFLAPEQARGVAAEVDAFSDQYSLAAVAFRMLAGADLFAGQEAISVLYHVLHDTPRPLTAVVRIDPEVEAVLRKAMSREKQDRFGSVIAFVKALEDAAAGHTVSRPVMVPSQTSSGVRKSSSWFFRRARTEEVEAPPQESDESESQPEAKEEAQVSTDRLSGEYRVQGRGDDNRSSIGRRLTLRDTLSERFFAEGERKEEEGDWTPDDLEEEQREGADEYDSFDSIPRRRWPMVVGLVAVAALVPLAGWMWPDWRTLFDARPSTFWAEPPKATDTVLPTSVPGTPATAPVGKAAALTAAPAAAPAAAAPAPAQAPAAAAAEPPVAIVEVPPPAAAVPAKAAPPAAPEPAAQVVAPPPRPAAPPPPPAPAQPITVPAVPVQAATPPPAAAQPVAVPAVPVQAAPAQPLVDPAAPPSSVGTWAPRPTAPAVPTTAAPPAPGREGNVPLRGYVWSPKERRLVPAQ